MKESSTTCAFAGCPAGKACICGLLAYLIGMTLLLSIGFILVWVELQAAIAKTMVTELLNNVVGTTGGDSLFAVKVVSQGGEGKPPVQTLIISDAFAVMGVFISGAFGGIIHAARSFYFHVYEGDLEQADAIKLILRPFSGAILAQVFYLVLRAGLSQSPENPGEGGASIIFYLAIGALVGMFTDQTVAKLKQVAEAILAPPEKPDTTPKGEQ